MALFVVSIESLENLKYNSSLKKHQFFLLFAAGVKTKMEKKINEEESTEILKILCLIENI